MNVGDKIPEINASNTLRDICQTICWRSPKDRQANAKRLNGGRQKITRHLSSNLRIRILTP